MKIAPSAIIFLSVAYAVSGREIPTDVESQIIGGSNAPSAEYPYQVSLRVYFKHFCGGSILNNRWILTTARCIYSKRPDEISVIAGTNYLSEAGQMYQAIFKSTHPRYNSFNQLNDIGMILVSRNIVLADKIRAISLPTGDFTKVNYPATFTGWGVRSSSGSLSIKLQQTKLTVISQRECFEKQNKVTNNHICTLDKAGIGACSGDEGGPLVADGVQIGIFSFSESCGKGHPVVYTRVWSFVEWIDQTIKGHKLNS